MFGAVLGIQILLLVCEKFGNSIFCTLITGIGYIVQAFEVNSLTNNYI